MEAKKAIKKVIALGAGAIMIGATIMGAMAADLKEYPSPFLDKDKKLGAYFVYGKAAQTIDVMGAGDIIANMQSEAIVKKPIEGGSTVATVSGDSWQIGTTSNHLEIGENFDAILSKVGASQLKALASVEVDNAGGGSGKYDQYIILNQGTVNFSKNDASSSGSQGVGTFLYFQSTAKFLNYSMVFTDPWDATLSSTTTSDVTYMEEDKLKILGKDWTVVDATRPASTKEDSLKLVLIGGGVPITMKTGDEAQTIEISGVSHEVSVANIYSTKAFITLDGVTSEINSGDIKTVGNLLIGITSISTSSKEAVADTVKFVVGGQKLELKDNEIQDNTASDNQLKVGSGSSVPYSEVIMKGTDDNATVSLNEIDINLHTDRAYYLDGSAGFKKLSGVLSNTYLRQAMEALDVDLQYEGLTNPDSYDIKISGGSSQYYLEFQDVAGHTFNLPIAYKESTTAVNLTWGDGTYRLVLAPNTNVSRNNRFILTDDITKPDSDTEVLTYTSSTYDSSASTISVSLDAMGGTPYTVTMTLSGGTYSGPLVVGGVSYTLSNFSAAANDCQIKIGRDAGTAVYDYLIAKGGIKIQLANNWTHTVPIALSFDVVDKNQQMVDSTNSPTPQVINFSFTQPASGDSYIQLARALPTTSVWKQKTGESTLNRFENYYGLEAIYESPSGASQTATIKVPLKQRLPQVFLTSGATVSDTTTAAGSTSDQIVPFNVGSSKLDTEIIDEFGNDFASKVNLIVVGGPAVNSVAASLLGNPSEAQIKEMFLPGESVIKLFENGEKVSMLVAGWTGDDTKKACEIVAKHKDAKGFEGKDIRVKTVDGTVTKVEAKAAVPVAAAPAAE